MKAITEQDLTELGFKKIHSMAHYSGYKISVNRQQSIYVDIFEDKSRKPDAYIVENEAVEARGVNSLEDIKTLIRLFS